MFRLRKDFNKVEILDIFGLAVKDILYLLLLV